MIGHLNKADFKIQKSFNEDLMNISGLTFYFNNISIIIIFKRFRQYNQFSDSFNINLISNILYLVPIFSIINETSGNSTYCQYKRRINYENELVNGMQQCVSSMISINANIIAQVNAMNISLTHIIALIYAIISGVLALTI